MFAIEKWGSPSCIQNAMQKIGKDNQKVGKIGRVISQAITIGPEHDKIRAQWALDVLSKNMLENLQWCKHSEIKF
jgi:hypothetical protein